MFSVVDTGTPRRKRNRKRPLPHVRFVPPRNMVELPIWVYLMFGYWPPPWMILQLAGDAEAHLTYRESPRGKRRARKGRLRGKDELELVYKLDGASDLAIAWIVLFRDRCIGNGKLCDATWETIKRWVQRKRPLIAGMRVAERERPVDKALEASLFMPVSRQAPWDKERMWQEAVRAMLAARVLIGTPAAKKAVVAAYKRYAPYIPGLAFMTLPWADPDGWTYDASIADLAACFVGGGRDVLQVSSAPESNDWTIVEAQADDELADEFGWMKLTEPPFAGARKTGPQVARRSRARSPRRNT